MHMHMHVWGSKGAVVFYGYETSALTPYCTTEINVLVEAFGRKEEEVSLKLGLHKKVCYVYTSPSIVTVL